MNKKMIVIVIGLMVFIMGLVGGCRTTMALLDLNDALTQDVRSAVTAVVQHQTKDNLAMAK